MKQGIESTPNTSSTSHSVVQELVVANAQLKEENQQLKAKIIYKGAGKPAIKNAFIPASIICRHPGL